MKLRRLFALIIFFTVFPFSRAQAGPKPEPASKAVIEAFKTHDIVMLGEFHDNKQLYEWLRSLVATPAFADRVDDIVMEFGNSLYQKSVDDYVSGKDVPMEKVQKAWQNTVGSIGAPSPVYASLYRAVRETNMKRRGKHQMRVLCGDPYIDWEKATTMQDVNPYMAHRDDWYAQVVKDEVIARHHRALLIMGSMHFLRNFSIGPMHATIEPELLQAGAKTYLIIAGTNTSGPYPEIDHRFDTWHVPAIASATGWLGDLPARPLIDGGQDTVIINMKTDTGEQVKKPSFTELKLKDATDAFLYLGPYGRLTVVETPRAELEGTPYGNEIQRRLKIEKIFAPPSEIFAEKAEAPQFPPPEPEANQPLPPPAPQKAAAPQPVAADAAPSPVPKKKFELPPLPPRPPSQ